MPDFWLDTDSFVVPNRGPYRFATIPKFWEFLVQKAAEQVIASSELVLQELIGGGDELETWAKRQQGTLFLPPDQAVQRAFSQVATSVQTTQRYAPEHVTRFLSGADPWLITHARALGDRVVTFEKPEPNSKKPKIPDVANVFGVHCIDIWDMLTALNASF